MPNTQDEHQLIRSQLLTLAALVLVAGLIGAGAYIYSKEEERSMRISEIERIDRIEIHKPEWADEGRADIILVRRGEDEWYVDQPFLAKATASRINSLTPLARRTFERAYTLDEVELEQLGLDPPGVRVRFNDVEIALGDTDPVDNLRYALHNDRVLLLDKAEYDLLNSDVYGLLENRLTQYNSDIVSVRSGRYQLSADEQTGDWVWTQLLDALPYPGHEDIEFTELSTGKDQISKWLDGFTGAFALRASAGAELRAKGPDSLPKLSIELANGESVHYELLPGEEETIFHDPSNSVNHHYSTESQDSLLALPLKSDGEEAGEPPVSSPVILDQPRTD